mmetsp:Transcript_23275/g.68718  ORF Transcript_23275/g.68718 Transcript_23275/m.68718 type:complete len:215 (-) Transcript_23275:441-1085(-)
MRPNSAESSSDWARPARPLARPLTSHSGAPSGHASKRLALSARSAPPCSPPMMTSKRPIGTARSFASSLPSTSATISPCCFIDKPSSGPPKFHSAFSLLLSATVSTSAAARSASEIGLQVAQRPSPRSKYTKGAPLLTTSSWPETDLKKAVGRTMEYVISVCSRSLASNSIFAYWNCSAYGSFLSADLTQNADSSTKWRAPAARAASRQLSVAW